jgi:hypothetical protein
MSEMGCGCKAQVIWQHLASWAGLAGTHQEEIQDESWESLEASETDIEGQFVISKACQGVESARVGSNGNEERGRKLFGSCRFGHHVLSKL